MTSDPKFTPGPWTLDESGCITHRPKRDVYRSMIPPDFLNEYLKILSPWKEDAWEDDKEALANAHLIAAAPDLYAAVKAYKEGHPDRDAIADAALSKACGES